MALKAVPQHLLEDALVVAGQQHMRSPAMQCQAQQGEQAGCDLDGAQCSGAVDGVSGGSRDQTSANAEVA